jgi:hypothetical protein
MACWKPVQIFLPFLIICRQNQLMNPNLRALFCKSPFDDQIEYIHNGSPRPVYPLILDCLRFESVIAFLFALRIHEESKLEGTSFLQMILLSLGSSIYPGVQVYLSQLMDCTPSVRSARVSPRAELEAAYSTAQEEIYVLETRCMNRREPIINSFQSSVVELYMIAQEKLTPLRNGPAVMELVDLQILQQAFDNETAWWRFWIPLST